MPRVNVKLLDEKSIGVLPDKVIVELPKVIADAVEPDDARLDAVILKFEALNVPALIVKLVVSVKLSDSVQPPPAPVKLNP